MTTFTEDHAPLFSGAIKDWKIARKTGIILAKPINSIIVDKTVVSKFLISTLEGNESLDINTLMCLGSDNEPWQQIYARLLRKYDIVSIDENGWLVCSPKPDNRIEFFQWNDKIITKTGEHYVKSIWGENFRTYGNCQRFSQGDYICRDIDNTNDVWVVRKKLFDTTYAIIS